MLWIFLKSIHCTQMFDILFPLLYTCLYLFMKISKEVDNHFQCLVYLMHVLQKTV